MGIEIGYIINNQIIKAVKPPHIKEQRQKQIRKVYKRFNELGALEKALGYEKLENPIRHGWYKEIVLTRRVSRYKNEEAILEVFDKIHKAYWGRTKEEAERQWFKYVSNYYIYRDFPTLSKKQFNKLSSKAQRLCTAYKYKNRCKKWRVRFYLRIPKSAYRIKYTRAYITHRKRIDPMIISEDALLDQQLLKKGFYNLDHNNRSWKNYLYEDGYKKQKLKIKRQLNQLKHYDLEDVIKDHIAWERN